MPPLVSRARIGFWTCRTQFRAGTTSPTASRQRWPAGRPPTPSEVRRLLDAGLERHARSAAPRRGPGSPTSWPRPGCRTTPSTATSAPRTRWWPPSSTTAPRGCAATSRTRWRRRPTPEGQVRRWVEGVLSQADDEVAATTLAVIWNGDSVNGGSTPGRQAASAAPGMLLEEPFAALGSARPELDAALVAHAVFGRLAELLWQGAHADRGRGRPPGRLLPRRGRPRVCRVDRAVGTIRQLERDESADDSFLRSCVSSCSTASVSRPAARMWARARGATPSHCE